jgi:hypothetical protein
MSLNLKFYTAMKYDRKNKLNYNEFELKILYSDEIWSKEYIWFFINFVNSYTRYVYKIPMSMDLLSFVRWAWWQHLSLVRKVIKGDTRILGQRLYLYDTSGQELGLHRCEGVVLAPHRWGKGNTRQSLSLLDTIFCQWTLLICVQWPGANNH